MTHQATISSVNEFFEELVSLHFALAEKVSILQNQLMTKTIYTRFHDNIYGRVFDSAFASALVKKTTEEVQDAMTKISKGFGAYLAGQAFSIEDRQNVSLEIKDLLIKKDPRFWFPATPDLEAISTMADEDVIPALIEYLCNEKKSGYECISVPYLIVYRSGKCI